MSAITPFLEQQEDSAETVAESEWFSAIDPLDLIELSGLGVTSEEAQAMGIAKLLILREEALNASHAQLIRTAWMRQAVYSALEGAFIRLRTVSEIPRGRPGIREENVKLDIVDANGDPVKLNDPPWNRPSLKTSTLLTWTSKMGAPSFSIPAGPPGYGGSCPGAMGGQSIVPERQLLRAKDRVAEILNKPVDIARCICQFCYAETGRYGTAMIQGVQVLSFLWAKQAVLDGGNFVEVMDWAVKHADYRLDGEGRLPAEPTHHPYGRFFRIHDSGDFFSRRYLQGWAEVARLNPDIGFWAPSRLWATNNWVTEVAESTGIPPNLAIRPSAYMVNDPTPQGLNLGAGWVDWSVVYAKEVKPYDTPGPHNAPDAAYNWDCQAYIVDDDLHNCRAAESPDGKIGCRTCWVMPETSVNYTLHK